MKCVLFYETAIDQLHMTPTHMPAHSARIEEFHKGGSLLMVGTWANPAEGAMAIFTDRESAERFAREDPFVLNGIVAKWTTREWNEFLV